MHLRSSLSLFFGLTTALSIATLLTPSELASCPHFDCILLAAADPTHDCTLLNFHQPYRPIYEGYMALGAVFVRSRLAWTRQVPTLAAIAITDDEHRPFA